MNLLRESVESVGLVDWDPEVPLVKEAFQGYRVQKVTRVPQENRFV